MAFSERTLTEEEQNPILGLNIVEYAGNNQAKIDSQVTALCQQLDEKIAQGKDHIIGYQLCSDLPSIERIYAMRKKAVGLLGNAKGAAKPIPLWKIPVCHQNILLITLQNLEPY